MLQMFRMYRKNKFLPIFTFLIASLCMLHISILSAIAKDKSVASSKAVDSTESKLSPYELVWDSETYGPSFRATDGDEGRGSKISSDNYLESSFRIYKNWQLGAAAGFSLNTAPRRVTKVNTFDLLDHYAVIKNDALYTNSEESFNLTLEIRNYFPTSQPSKESAGEEFDRYYGRSRARYIIDYAIPGTKLGISLDHRWHHYRAKSPIPDGVQIEMESANLLLWEASESFIPYIGYNNYWTYQQDGIWQPWSKYHAIETGFEWYPSGDKIKINPLFESPLKSFKDTTIRLLASVYLFE